jgi:hypothetical protein
MVPLSDILSLGGRRSPVTVYYDAEKQKAQMRIGLKNRDYDILFRNIKPKQKEPVLQTGDISIDRLDLGKPNARYAANMLPLLIPEALGQEQSQPDAPRKDAAFYAPYLQSLDPTVRQNAIRELADLGDVALPWIANVLSDRQSAAELKLGASIALTRIREQRSAWPKAILDGLIAGATDENITVRYNVRVYLRNHFAEQATSAIEAKISETQGNSRDELIYRDYLSMTLFEMYYHVGATDLNKFIDNNLKADKAPSGSYDLLSNALDHFKGALKYQQYALSSGLDPGELDIQFSSALFGLGVVYHQAYWKKVPLDGLNDAELQRLSVDNFKAAITLAGKSGFRYPLEITEAKSCVTAFTPTCLYSDT